MANGTYVTVLRENVARPEGFEPPTYGLEVRCSIQLSYGRKVMFTDSYTECTKYYYSPFPAIF